MQHRHEGIVLHTMVQMTRPRDFILIPMNISGAKGAKTAFAKPHIQSSRSLTETGGRSSSLFHCHC